jgi:dienelactone hydrolase
MNRETVRIPVGGVELEADIVVPDDHTGAVLFAHGSGSSRHSPRNKYVASELQAAGFTTVLADLLTRSEEEFDARTAKLRFDIPLLSARVVMMTEWLSGNSPAAEQPIGLFGASTGAAAALIAAAARPAQVNAVVSRGGRPDLASDFLYLVPQPTLLIVGERDGAVIELNRRALERLRGEAVLEIVPGATHLFEEAGALEHVAQLARDWFAVHLHGRQLHHAAP